jgi:hypothetical protein
LRSGGYFLGNYFGSSVISSFLSLFLIIWIIRHEPIKDYRPFAVGSNLRWKMNDGLPGTYENSFVLQNISNGNKQTYSESEYMNNSQLWDEKKYKFIEKNQKEIIPARLPSITDQFNPFLTIDNVGESELKLDFVQNLLNENRIVEYLVKDLSTGKINRKSSLELDRLIRDSVAYDLIDSSYRIDPNLKEVNIKDALLHADQVVILISRNLNEANWKHMSDIKALENLCANNNIPFLLLTNAGKSSIDKFRIANKWDVPIFMNDATGLKTIVRSNPSVMILTKGIVVGKYPHRSIPTFEFLIREKVIHK